MGLTTRRYVVRCDDLTEVREFPYGPGEVLPTHRIVVDEAEVERLRAAIRKHREQVKGAIEEHGPPMLALDDADTDLWSVLNG